MQYLVLTQEGRSEEVAERNDLFRRSLELSDEGSSLIFLNFEDVGLSEDDKAILLERVKYFDYFPSDSDPFGEHDYGWLYYGEAMITWKIDYLDVDGRGIDPLNPLCKRVIMIMRGAC